MQFDIRCDASIGLRLVPKDAQKNLTVVPAPPQWSTDRESLVRLRPSADGMSCTVTALGALGSGSITVRCGELVAEAQFTVFPAAATSLSIELDDKRVAPSPTARPQP